MDVYLSRKRLRLTPQQAIGKGGEADVFALDQQRALKVFKAPTHPDYSGQAHEQQAAAARLAEQQAKLPAFPSQVPERVIRPQELATDRKGRTILGYSMRLVPGATALLRYAERSFRQTGVGAATVVAIFRDMHQTLTALHQAGAVVGDMNDLNILVCGTAAYFIDADSFQFGAFPCRVFTARFVDPLLCAPQATAPLLQQPHNAASDWYAFTVMLMQCLLFVGPYGGLYRPADPAQRLPHEARPLRRLTIFHPEVQYPKPALPYRIVPDELLHYWHQVYTADLRQPFPLALLDGLHWQHCGPCGLEHARPVCPRCAPGLPTRRQPYSQAVTVQRLFHTAGLIVHAAMQDGALAWVYHEQRALRREDGRVIHPGALDPHLHYQVCGATTLLGQAGQVISLTPGQAPERHSVDSVGTRPLFASNGRSCYWVAQGQLLGDGPWGPRYVGDVLAAQTHFWVGPRFGFGLYHAGELRVAFTFDTERRGLNDTFRLPPLPGPWLEAHCVFTETQCWCLVATQTQGHRRHHCLLLDAHGSVIAMTEAAQHDGSWLGTLAGHCAVGPWLFAPTDAGIIRVEAQHGQLVPTRLFAETEPFVSSACHLFAGQQGMYVVDRQDIHLLSLH